MAPNYTIYLLQLSKDPTEFISTIEPTPIYAARVLGWVYPPKDEQGLNHRWNLLLIAKDLNTTDITNSWSLPVSISDEELDAGINQQNQVVPKASDYKPNEHVSPSLNSFLLSNDSSTPVTMFNLMKFKPAGLPIYMQYVSEFGSTLGVKFGGAKKMIGTSESSPWDIFGLVQYPTMLNFRETLLSPEYAELEARLKQPSLEDNPILACVDVEL